VPEQAGDQPVSRKGRMHRLLLAAKYLSLLMLVFIAVPFMVDHVRVGIYPQLERHFQLGDERYFADANRFNRGLEAERDKVAPLESLASAPVTALQSLEPPEMKKRAAGYRPLVEIDPDAIVQTGPGLPQWQWLSIPLSWNGPVAQSQTMGLVLLSPPVNRLLNFVRAAVMAGFILLFFGVVGHPGTGTSASTDDAAVGSLWARCKHLLGGARR